MLKISNKIKFISFVLIFTLCFSTASFGEESLVTQTIPLMPQTMEAYSNRQVHEFSGDEVVSPFNTMGFLPVLENDDLVIYLSKTYDSIRIKDKSSGYIWGALPLDEAEGLNNAWISFGNSIVAIECFNESGIEKRYGLSSNGEVSYDISDDAISFSINYEELEISFEGKVTLENNTLNFSVDGNSIKEGEVYKLKSMMFMPFLGSSYSDNIDGYMLIPEGSGALMRFTTPQNNLSSFSKKIYGEDYAIDILPSSSNLNSIRPDDYMVAEQQILMPLYGIVHGQYQNGFLAVVDSGAEYASIIANTATNSTPYNWGGVRFEFRQKYNLSTNRKEGTGTTVPQDDINIISPSLSLHFCSDTQASYDAMAVYYRGLLEENGVLNSSEACAAGIKIEILSSGKQDNFFKTIKVFTSFEEAFDIVSDIKLANIENIQVVVRGYTKNDEVGNKLYKSLGNTDDIDVLKDFMNSIGGEMYLYIDPLAANEDQINLRLEGANNLSKILINLQRQNDTIMYSDNYFYRLSEAVERIDKSLKYFGNFDFAVNSLGYRLYGDYSTNNEFTRQENLQTINEIGNSLSQDGKLPFYCPNEYLWENTSDFYDTPVTSSQFLYETDTVPFLEIVLSGNINMYSQSLNIGTYSQARLLRLVEYGVNPSFVVTACESEDLFKTAYEDYFSTNYNDWKDKILDAYTYINKALKEVEGESISSHIIIKEGLVKTSYENGVSIYVNYTDKDEHYNNMTISSMDYFVERA